MKTKTNVHTSAVTLGSLGGKKGGPSRAQKLTPNERSKIAQKGGEAKARKAKD